MYNSGSVKIDLPDHYDRIQGPYIKGIISWCRERNIKYSFNRHPQWSIHPTSITLRSEDALAFKLAFGL